jgi:hypothetical protein
MNTLQTKLKELEACDEAIEWAKDYDTLQQAWDNCQRGDWMIWLINEMEWSNEKDLRLMAVAFARQVQHLMNDQRSINALDVAERYANGEANIEELTAAWVAAWAAGVAARAARVARAAGAAWEAEEAEEARAARAAWAAWAAWAAGAVGAARAARVAWEAEAAGAARADQANIIRQYLPTVTF